MSDKTYSLVEAVNLALARAMADDENVVVLGEDVGVNGGVFRATLGLRERFGRRRVIDTPLAETILGGLAVGMAAQGLKPVVEIQFMGFIYAAMEHLVSHASRLRNRTRGRLSCPLVMRNIVLPCVVIPLLRPVQIRSQQRRRMSAGLWVHLQDSGSRICSSRMSQ